MNKEDDYLDIDEYETRWKKYNEKWYNKYFIVPIGTAYRSLKEFPYCIKYFIQRGKQGWSDKDAWSIDYWLVNSLIPMLEILRTNKQGVPSSMYRVKDGVDDEADVLAEQRWDNVLGEILYGLKCAKKLQDMDYDYEDQELGIKLTKSSQRSFKLIGTHLFNLWN
jgi:hypothetical protein|tara:strand:+ start:789 stop:1283 length:495 start_codon:yes stop_codon:yes gene_type:complete